MKASVTNDTKITLTSETTGEMGLLKRIAELRYTRWGISVLGVGSDCDVIFVPMGTESKAERLTTPIFSTASQELTHIPSQRQAAKAASFYAELHKHHIPPGFAEQLTLEYLRMEMKDA